MLVNKILIFFRLNYLTKHKKMSEILMLNGTGLPTKDETLITTELIKCEDLEVVFRLSAYLSILRAKIETSVKPQVTSNYRK